MSDHKKLVNARIKALRPKLINTSRRNPLLNNVLAANNARFIPLVDEKPQNIVESLVNEKVFKLSPLPPFDEFDLPDEKSRKFKSALEKQKLLDEEYIEELKKIRPSDPRGFEKEANLERELRDRVRRIMGMPDRPKGTRQTDLINHAKIHGIDPSTTLPEAGFQAKDRRHRDLNLQTLLIPSTLESRVRNKIINKQKEFSEERGLRVTFLVVGYLEWIQSEAATDDAPFKSPLLLIPVDVTRAKSKVGFEFRISKVGEVCFNPILKHKLQLEFGVSAERLFSVDENNINVESFFNKVQKGKPQIMKKWEVLREATLGIYPFQGIELHHDLRDDHIDFSDFNVLEELFLEVNTNNEASEQFSQMEEEGAVRGQPPVLIMDADSSQSMALEKISQQKNLAMEGPPGSGKSQTIVNAIANALNDGKKVLFVAQKRTALDVVFARLKSLNLDKFVLPLMTVKGDSENFYDAIGKRRSASNVIKPRNSLEIKKKQNLEEQFLEEYRRMLMTRLEPTSISAYEAMGFEISKDNVSGLDEDEFSDVELDMKKFRNEFSLEDIDDAASDFEDLISQVNEVEISRESPWSNLDLTVFDESKIQNLLEDSKRLLNKFDAFQQSVTGDLRDSMNRLVDGYDVETVSTVLGVRDELESMPWGFGETDRSKLFALESAYSKACELIIKVDESYNSCGINLAQVSNLNSWPDSLDKLKDFLIVGGIENVSGLIVSKVLAEKEQLLEEKAELQRKVSALRSELGEISPPTIQLLQQCLLKSNIESWFESYLKNGGIRQGLAHVNHFKNAISKSYSLLVNDKSLPDSETLNELSKTIKNTGLLKRWFGKKYKSAKKDTLAFLGGEESNQKFDRIRYADRLDLIAKEVAKLEQSPLYLHLLLKVDKLDYSLMQSLENLSKELTFVADVLDQLGFSDDDFNRIRKSEILAELIEDLKGQSVGLSTWEEHFEDLPDAQNFILKYSPEVSSLQGSIDFCQNHRLLLTPAIDSCSKKLRSYLDLYADFIQITDDLPGSLEEYTRENLELSLFGVKKLLSLEAREASMLELFESNVFADLVKDNLSLFEDLFLISSELCLLTRYESHLPGIKGSISNIQWHLSDPEGWRSLLIRRDVFDRSQAAGFGTLFEFVSRRAGSISPKEAFQWAVRLWLKRRLAFTFGSKLWRKFTKSNLDLAEHRYSEFDREIIGFSNRLVAAECLNHANPPKGVSRGRKSELTDLSLIDHELTKTRRIPPRKLLRRAHDALLELFPCWMMDPTSVAQHLERREIFDLVIIDEASQMTPEVSVSALMRGKTALIAGDTNQLPPTNYFQSILKDEEQDSDIEVAEESILELGNAAFSPKHRLKWHYRSRHESLIQFSNHYVYENDLVIFPAPSADSGEMGVQLHRVDGVFMNGINPEESESMVQKIREFMSLHPDKSLGVVVMNQAQMEFLDAEIMRLADHDRHVANYLRSWRRKNEGLEKFFVKNLENVQGDERDVIFIGTVYGKDEDGKFAQRFGPINGKSGKRRLNVLFTRAKERMETFSSIPIEVFTPNETNEGATLLKRWLEYSSGESFDASLVLGDSESVHLDPFQEYLVESLEKYGFICVPKVGVSNFYVDIGIRHPNYTKGYLCGLELDGPAYQNVSNTRDRHRLKHDVLVRLGWDILRVWSTEWFLNREIELESLIQNLNDLLEKKSDG